MVSAPEQARVPAVVLPSSQTARSRPGWNSPAGIDAFGLDPGVRPLKPGEPREELLASGPPVVEGHACSWDVCGARLVLSVR